LVRSRPPVPVVFTSRTEPASFAAAAPDGEEFRYPGKRLWAAREGRLRVLTPRGTVHELTWGKPLPDGGTLIDVMSPSVSLDGKRVLFAGRRADDHGHFRLYGVNLDGTDLRPLTGGPDDPGAVAVPPMRFRADNTLMPDDERRRVDYDDVDPVEIRGSPREVVFASSRTPDLGRDHARRSTTLWVLRPDGPPAPLTANRNNDRWPYLLASGYVGFSLWSRNREVITAHAPSAKPAGAGLPTPRDYHFRQGVFSYGGSSLLWAATPSPCPPGHILLAAAVSGGWPPAPGSYGLYLASDDWPDHLTPDVPL